MNEGNVDLGKYKDHAFTPQQRNMIRKGLALGLDVSDYANTSYDYLQMEQILLCKIKGVDPSLILDPDIPYKAMEKTRLKLFDELKIFELEKEKLNSKRQKRMITLAVFLIMISSAALVFYANKEIILKYLGTPYLELTTNTVKIGLSEISSFDSISYVKEYADDFELTLPKYSFNTVGEYDLQYEISNGVKDEIKTLNVNVLDDIEPVIQLSNTNVILEYGSNFNAADYLVKATDNIDGDIQQKVQIDEEVNTSKSGDYLVSYEVDDAAGNETLEELIVHINEQRKDEVQNTTTPEISLNGDNENESKNIEEDESGGGGSKSNNTDYNPSQYDKYFEGNSVDIYNEAILYAKVIFNKSLVNGYSVMPTGEGFQVVFE